MTIVSEFHTRMGEPGPPTPPLRPDHDLIRLRMRLIREEFEEVMAELTSLLKHNDADLIVDTLRGLLKELADLRYVVEGTAVSLGLPIDDAFVAVHKSNMTKEPCPDGSKARKGDGYVPADMTPFVPDIISQ